MSRTIEVNVSESAYERMKAQADEVGVSLADYVGQRLEAGEVPLRKKPSLEQVRQWLSEMTPLESDFDAGEIIREGREERDEELWQAISDSLPSNDRR